MQRAALVNLGELSTYDAAKRAVLRSGVTGGDNAWAHAASSVCSGFCASGEAGRRLVGGVRGRELEGWRLLLPPSLPRRILPLPVSPLPCSGLHACGRGENSANGTRPRCPYVPGHASLLHGHAARRQGARWRHAHARMRLQESVRVGGCGAARGAAGLPHHRATRCRPVGLPSPPPACLPPALSPAEGLRGLYAGFLPTWARLGPWQLTFWLSFEQLRKAAGLGGF